MSRSRTAPWRARRFYMGRAAAILIGVALCAGHLLAAAPAMAGGNEWSFDVLEVLPVPPDRHIIRLQPTPPGKAFPRSCETLEIHSYYEVENWSAAGRTLAPRSGHERAILYLIQAQALKNVIRLRTVGYGFGSPPEAPPCQVTSRALNIAADPGGTPVIFSLYEDPKGSR